MAGSSGWKHVPLPGVLSSAYREIHATRVINKYRTFLARPFVALQVVLNKNTRSKGNTFPPELLPRSLRLLFSGGEEIKRILSDAAGRPVVKSSLLYHIFFSPSAR